LLLEAAAFVREAALSAQLNFHEVFFLKNIPAERVNSRNWKPALVFAGKEVWWNGVLTAQGVSHIVIPVPGPDV